MIQRIQYPFGRQAGKEAPLPDVLGDFITEMMNQRVYLRYLAHRAQDQPEAEHLLTEADDLEKYAVTLLAVYYQLRPERWDLETHGEMIKLAKKYKVTLPDWMRQPA